MFKKIAAVTAAAALFAATPFALASCDSGSDWTEYYVSMGTEAKLVVSGVKEKTFAALSEEVSELLFDAEQSLSSDITSSSVYAFNAAAAGEEVEIDSTAYAVISLALEMCGLTGGAYNPAVYYSVEAFGFGYSSQTQPTTLEQLPTEEETDAYAQLASHFTETALTQKNGKYYAAKPDFTVTVGEDVLSLKIDLGGIGKGWCADRVNEILDGHGVTCGYFSFASSTMAIKKYRGGDGKYTLGPRNPDSLGESYATFKCADVRLSTSALYERLYEIDGEKFWHIMDPSTGRPAQTDITSVTVTGENAAECDALTTALICMGRERAVEFINENMSENFVVMLVDDGGQPKIITNRPQEISVEGGGFEVINAAE